MKVHFFAEWCEHWSIYCDRKRKCVNAVGWKIFRAEILIGKLQCWCGFGASFCIDGSHTLKHAVYCWCWFWTHIFHFHMQSQERKKPVHGFRSFPFRSLYATRSLSIKMRFCNLKPKMNKLDQFQNVRQFEWIERLMNIDRGLIDINVEWKSYWVASDNTGETKVNLSLPSCFSNSLNPINRSSIIHYLRKCSIIIAHWCENCIPIE